jgi:hypothetical protein
MRKLKAVQWLIVISHDAEVRSITEKINNALFGLVEVLIFVHKHAIV